MIRITPPSTVEWYDVDFPAVIAARKRLVPDRANAHGIGADLTPEAGWTPSLVTDRPSSSQTA
jgi:O-methyltransferase involved in polyketide biosynthesis